MTKSTPAEEAAEEAEAAEVAVEAPTEVAEEPPPLAKTMLREEAEDKTPDKHSRRLRRTSHLYEHEVPDLKIKGVGWFITNE